MDRLKLYVANKNYSSWSMRAWLALKAAGILFMDEVIPFDYEHGDPAIKTISATGKLPVLMHGRGDGTSGLDRLVSGGREGDLDRRRRRSVSRAIAYQENFLWGLVKRALHMYKPGKFSGNDH